MGALGLEWGLQVIQALLRSGGKILDDLEVVHVFTRRRNSCSQVLHKTWRRLGASLRKLGYPIKNSLVSGNWEFEREQDLRVCYSLNPGKYSAEQNQRVVQCYLDEDRCIVSTLRALGCICKRLITRWIDELHPKMRGRMMGHTPNYLHSQEVENPALLEVCN